MSGASDLVGTSSLVVVCGSGGVGKTTMAAAIGTALAVERDARVLVLTVDPARRLADALGLTGIGTDAVQVDVAVVSNLSRREPKNSRIRRGASRTSSALRDGGVSTTIRS